MTPYGVGAFYLTTSYTVVNFSECAHSRATPLITGIDTAIVFCSTSAIMDHIENPRILDLLLRSDFGRLNPERAHALVQPQSTPRVPVQPRKEPHELEPINE